MRKNKFNKSILIMFSIIALMPIVMLHVNNQVETTLVSKNIAEPYTVKLEENNSIIIKENHSAKIKKYNGNAETLIIDADTIDGSTIEIDSKAFAECTNLDTILIEKSLASENIEIEDFEVNTEYEDEQYIAYTTTKVYSEAYQQYLKLSEEEKSEIEAIPDKYCVSMSALYSESMEENYNVSEIVSEEIPTSFDLRNKINIKVENQEETGTCYAYASLTSVETNEALRNNDDIDLSEVHAAGMTSGYGGNFFTASNSYYLHKIGPIYESEWPMEKVLANEKDEITHIIYKFLTGANSNITQEESEQMQNALKSVTAKKYVAETVRLPYIDKSSENIKQEEIKIARNVVKTHIMEYGSLYASIASSGITGGTNGTNVLNATWKNLPDHAISIIGWDDSFSKYNFPSYCQPSNDGAYLALNSWGENWGDSGYFWISYEDYWVESNLSGVISVEDIAENINISYTKIHDIETNEEISNAQIIRGKNIQIEMSVELNELKNNEKEFEIKVISSTGMDITDKVLVSGNSIEENKAKVLFDFDTKLLECGLYTINLEYGTEKITRTFEINPNIFDYYIKEDGTITITSYFGEERDLVIPEEFLGFKVTGIESGAFVPGDWYESSKIDSITIYSNIIQIGDSIMDSSTIIYGYSETYIEEYANLNGYLFIDLEEEVIEGEGWYYNLEEGKLYILENLEEQPYQYLKNVVCKIEIASTTQEIFANQFAGYKNVNEIIIPNTITKIGAEAFSYCSKLENIILPTNLTSISTAIFNECSSLKNINIPSSVTSIGAHAFYNCRSLTSIEIPTGVTAIGEGAFEKCIELETVEIYENIVTTVNNEIEVAGGWGDDIILTNNAIGNWAFQNCTNLTKVQLPSGITSIGEGAFGNCENLLNINIPEGVTLIGNHTFSGCLKLTNVELPNTITSIGDSAFYQCQSLCNIQLTDAITNIGESAFANCINLKSVLILQGTEDISNNEIEVAGGSGDVEDISNNKIGNWAFENCTSVTNIQLPSAITSIGDGAFSNCTNIQNINIPDEVTMIGNSAFSQCENLTEINIPENVTTLGNAVFYNCKSLIELNLPSNIIGIGSSAFSNCTKLQSINIPNGVKQINNYVFQGCENLNNINIPESITSIGEFAFGYCENLTNIELSNAITWIGYGAFFYCERLTNVNIPNGLTSIEASVFVGCESLVSLDIPMTVTRIGANAFASCTNLQSINIYEGITTIEDSAFYNCESLINIEIPSSIVNIGEQVFYGCKNLQAINVETSNDNYTSEEGVLFNKEKTTLLCYPAGKIKKEYTIPEGVTKIEHDAFANCENLSNIKFSNSIKNIGNYAFCNCTNLENINIPEGVRIIGISAFNNCNRVTQIEISSTVINIGNAAFFGCSDLLDINVNEDNTKYKSEDGVLFNKDKTEIICYPASKTDEKYTIPSGITIIPYEAFNNCKYLRCIEIPSTVTMIGNNTFEECNELAEIIVDEGNTSYKTENGVLFDKEKMQIICYPTSKRDAEYTIPSGIKTIAYGAFRNCKYLKKIEMLEGITCIEYGAFVTCPKLESVKISETVTSLDVYSFSSCNGIIEFIVDENNPAYSSKEGVVFNKEKTKIICYPAFKQEIQYIIPKEVTTIGGYSFSNCINLQIIKIPESITKIEYSAFYNCTNLVDIDLSEGLKNIEHDAFYGVILNKALPNGITELELPDIIKRSMDENDILYSDEEVQLSNCTLSDDGNNIIINQSVLNEEEISAKICSGVLEGLTLIIRESGTITYSTTDLTEGKVVATLHIAEGETVTNNDGKNTHIFTKNGDFTFEYIDINGNRKNATAKVENIDVSNLLDAESIEVITDPDKIDYKAYETFEATGMKVVVTYINGEQEETLDYTIIGGENLTCQNTKVEVQYNPNPEIKTEISINVEHDIEEATCTEPEKCKVEGCNYVYGDALDHSFTNYVSNNDATCKEDGTKTSKCDRCEETDTISDEGSKLPHSYENGKCTGCEQEEPKVTIQSEVYNISEEYVTKVTGKTTLEAFKETILTNAKEIKILNKDNQELTAEDIVGTGMTLILKTETETKELQIVVSGDTTGDGKIGFNDMVSINRHRLNKKTLENEYLLAADVNEDNKVDFRDLVKINRYRLKKITQLF